MNYTVPEFFENNTKQLIQRVRENKGPIKPKLVAYVLKDGDKGMAQTDVPQMFKDFDENKPDTGSLSPVSMGITKMLVHAINSHVDKVLAFHQFEEINTDEGDYLFQFMKDASQDDARMVIDKIHKKDMKVGEDGEIHYEVELENLVDD